MMHCAARLHSTEQNDLWLNVMEKAFYRVLVRHDSLPACLSVHAQRFQCDRTEHTQLNRLAKGHRSCLISFRCSTAFSMATYIANLYSLDRPMQHNDEQGDTVKASIIMHVVSHKY